MENREDLGELFLSANGMNAARRPLGEGIRGDSNAIVGLGGSKLLPQLVWCRDQGVRLNYSSMLRTE